jgi:chemotaxis protein histidine kinase CheA
MDFPDNPIIIELLPDFVDDFIRDITENYDCISQNKNEIYRFGHTLKGSAAQFQLKSLSEFGQMIMKNSEEENWVEIESLKQNILKLLYELKDEIKKRYNNF